MTAPKVTNRKRLLGLLIGVTLIFFVLVIRVGYIQIVWGMSLQQKALDQWTRDLPVAPKRGMLFDRNNNILAQSASADTIAVRPNQVSDPKKVAALLAPILEMDEDDLYKKISNTKLSEVWLKRQVSKEVANQVRQLEIKGIVFTEESKRYYPNGELAAHILGFTGIDGQGQDGIELYYDKYLAGTPGKIITETDVRGRELPYNVNRYIPPINGWNIVLTLDETIQYFTEKAVSRVMEQYNPKKVYAIVMDPNTGEILAMTNRPNFDPNDPPRHLGSLDEMQKYIKNFCCKDNLDPGSTFKIITSAAGLEEGVVGVNSTFFDPGYKMVDGQRISCWRAGGHGHETFVEAVQNSCNPVFMEVALRLGKDKFYQYIEAFGFGQKTGIDILGEEQGILADRKTVRNVDLARIGFGQSISVTPLQLITAVSAVINGGNLMRPYLAKEFYYVDTSTGEEKQQLMQIVQPQKIRQVISSETSKKMREILLSVVNEGGGRNAYIPGYRVGGKTGTAQKYGPSGGILRDKNISSFIGFAPADDPRIIVLLMVDEPDTPVTFGSVVAAPYVKMILEDTLKYLGVEPIFDDETQEESRMVEVPDVIGKDLAEASKILQDAGLQYLTDESGTIVKNQMPKPFSNVLVNTTVLLYMGSEEGDINNSDDSSNNTVVVPNVIGKSIREANNILVSKGLILMIDGSGIAVSQDPAPDSVVKIDTEITVKFEEVGQ